MFRPQNRKGKINWLQEKQCFLSMIVNRVADGFCIFKFIVVVFAGVMKYLKLLLQTFKEILKEKAFSSRLRAER